MATKKRAAEAKKIKLYAPLSTPAIGVGEELFVVDTRGQVEIPESRKAEFKKIGCTEEPPPE